jgi:hypothetical protein
MRLFTWGAALVLSGSAVWAEVDPLASMQLAAELAPIIGSETACGYTLSPPKVADFVTSRVQPEDTGFASNLNMLTMGNQQMVKSMSPSGLAAHCAAVTQSARHYGLTTD